MECRIVSKRLLEVLRNYLDEECEVNLRLSVEEILKSPSIDSEELPARIKESVDEQIEESHFYL